MKPFRFGVNVRQAQSRAEWAEKARKIEDLGYSTLTAPDHLTDLMAPMPALVSAAEATTHLRVGTNVLNNDFRHPVLVARQAAPSDTAPTYWLAPLVRVEIWRCLERLKAGGLSILLIDKHVEAFTRLADHHYVLEKGRVVWSGTSAELRARSDVQHRYLGV